MNCTIVPVRTGNTGIVMKGVKKNLDAVPRTRSIDPLQTTAVLGTSH